MQGGSHGIRLGQATRVEGDIGSGIGRKIVDDLRVVKPAFTSQSPRQIPVVKIYERLDPVRKERIDHTIVEGNTGLVHRATAQRKHA